MKTDKGYSHIGLATHDLDATRAFYEGVLGFTVIALDTIEIKEGGRVRHILFNVGRDQLIAFMEPKGVPSVPPNFDTSLYKGIGVPSGFYHIAFEASTLGGLELRKKMLNDHGIETSPILGHDWAKSVYFKDPVNGIALEFCCWTREWNENDARKGDHFVSTLKQLSVDGFDASDVEVQIGDRSNIVPA